MPPTRRLYGPTIQTGPGDYDPPDDHHCPSCDERCDEIDRLRGIVKDQEEALDALERDRDRFQRLLAVETGDATAAPEGWMSLGSIWERRDAGAFASRAVSGPAVWWAWECTTPAGRVHGRAPTALEAMEQADAAMRGEVTR